MLALKNLKADPTNWIVKNGNNNETLLPAVIFKALQVLMDLVLLVTAGEF